MRTPEDQLRVDARLPPGRLRLLAQENDDLEVRELLQQGQEVTVGASGLRGKSPRPGRTLLGLWTHHGTTFQCKAEV